MFGLLLKAVESYAIDPGLIPGRFQLRQESGVGQKIEIRQFFFIFQKIEILIQVLIKPT